MNFEVFGGHWVVNPMGMWIDGYEKTRRGI